MIKLGKHYKTDISLYITSDYIELVFFNKKQSLHFKIYKEELRNPLIKIPLLIMNKADCLSLTLKDLNRKKGGDKLAK